MGPPQFPDLRRSFRAMFREEGGGAKSDYALVIGLLGVVVLTAVALL